VRARAGDCAGPFAAYPVEHLTIQRADAAADITGPVRGASQFKPVQISTSASFFFVSRSIAAPQLLRRDRLSPHFGAHRR
jgi:hypothetical protein